MAEGSRQKLIRSFCLVGAQLDVEGLNITVKSPPTATAAKGKAKGKGRAKTEGTEILCDAKLKLQPGQRYALLGRNGSGKSSRLATAPREDA